MSRLKGSKGASDCIADMLGKVLDSAYPYMEDGTCSSYCKAIQVLIGLAKITLFILTAGLEPPSLYGSDGSRTLPNTLFTTIIWQLYAPLPPFGWLMGS